jgi:pyruvate dehydrogenase E2 component (dihydrolipoamide acetyltransferase)
MRHTVTMPALSDTMNVGRLMRWLKQPGDRVTKGEAIAEIETDKAVMEVEAFADGYLAGPLAAAETDLPLGATIAFIADTKAEAASAAADAPMREAAPAAAAAPAPATAAMPPTTAVAPPQPVRASPYARALAGKLGVDLAGVAAGSAAPVTAEQLLAATARPAMPYLEEGPPYTIERLSSLREAVARGMSEAMATPTFRLTAHLPLRPLQELAKAKSLSLSLLLVRACGFAIAEHPLVNAAYTPQGLARRERIDIGVAVDIPEGLVTPVLRDVAKRPLKDLAEEWSALRHKVKTRRLAAQDYRGATFYLSDLGIFPVIQSFDSVIPLGASAILSVAAAGKDGASSTLSCDHRVIYGADAARFLTTLAELLADPAKLAA